MKYLLSTLLMLFLFTQCTKNDNTECKAVLKDNCSCDDIYLPVCGCDGVTYGNECYAECSGINDFTQGACPSAMVNGDWLFMGYQYKDQIDVNQPTKKHNYQDVSLLFGGIDEYGIYRYSGKSSVNFFGGTYKTSTAGVIDLQGGLMTKIGGTVEATQFENTYMDAFDATYLFILKADVLLLYTTIPNQGDVMVFIKK